MGYSFMKLDGEKKTCSCYLRSLSLQWLLKAKLAFSEGINVMKEGDNSDRNDYLLLFHRALSENVFVFMRFVKEKFFCAVAYHDTDF